MLKKKQIVEIVSVVVIAFLIGTLLNFNFSAIAGKDEISSPPVWPVKLATETFIVFDHEYVAEYSVTETKAIDVDGYKTVHVLFRPAWETDIYMVCQWKFETLDGVEYLESAMDTSISGVHTFEVKSPTLWIRIVNNTGSDVPANTVIVYAQSG